MDCESQSQSQSESDLLHHVPSRDNFYELKVFALNVVGSVHVLDECICCRGASLRRAYKAKPQVFVRAFPCLLSYSTSQVYQVSLCQGLNGCAMKFVLQYDQNTAM